MQSFKNRSHRQVQICAGICLAMAAVLVALPCGLLAADAQPLAIIDNAVAAFLS